ncbi:uncharacterized protein LOC101862898 [Aplysia californica]|uniref:Uncharacterized protein LOC101862898 n=1 Tax=Aplysia californica TaxID=6500 RepID=A0ABM1A9P1_APLCA|nr:uncharacterized protein LOC101862898 [Aplysia californica]
MVLFDNVFPGQRVEVRWDDGIYKGTVRYKGPVATKKGDWVGIELDRPVGDTTGMLQGRRYFQCRPNYGVFVRADRLRFVPSVRCLYDKYHRVARASYIDEHLFDTARPDVRNGPYDPVAVSQNDFSRVKSSLGDYGVAVGWDQPKYYNLRHSVSNCLPAATMLRSETAGTPFRYLSRPYHVDYWMDDDFERKPSIPKTHMPHSALRQQVRQGWHGAHYVREMTVPTGRERMKFSQWNDISP